MRASRLPRLVHTLRRGWGRLRRPLTFGACALVIDARRRILLVRLSYLDGWHLPGGGVGKDETAAAAMRRELAEEVGLTAVGLPRLQGLYGRFTPTACDHVAVFVVEDWRGEPRPDGIEVIEAGFFTAEALPAATAQAVRRRIDEFLARKPIAERW
ncbi:MAG: NUDIX domain-containing protein [Azospirillum sp.]|nr:NUDIX domain-containing protein [Azospirillum sp.]